MILVIDNYDSFVANIARYLVELGADVRVARNDALDIADAERMEAEAIVLSPGPCTPREAGVSNALIAHFSGRLPILGICLGHQCIGDVFGGRVGRAREPMHGRSSSITHDGSDVFRGLPNPLTVGRYHSLIVEVDETDSPLRITARTERGETMGLAHRRHATYGVQFHPESILTVGGHAMLANFLRISADWRRT
ncbi:MAG TPA: aminodeoxychorismate/anthranilate synthase component II [Methylomirabilota bacterium]|nr:aminodeoxychorismate/anthranilate synthase component II [Methylomirabilota bacterium]